MGLWRDRVAGRRFLLLLDDAVGSEQVRPLLPGTAGCLVVVTSRRRLSALEDATAVSLDTLPPEDAAALFIRLAARTGLDPGDPAVGQITRLCGFLPLAVGLVARQLRHHPSWTPAELAAGLAAARDRLLLLQAEDLSVAAAFDLSYADLTGTSGGCSAAWGCTRARTPTRTRPPPWTGPIRPPPAAGWPPCTTSAC